MSLPVYLVDDDEAVREALSLLLRTVGLTVRGFAGPEAFLGALYIDGGLDAARKAFDFFWSPNLETLSRRHRDAKTTLQEWSQERGLGPPKYDVVNAEGPAHAPAFTIDVQVPGFEPVRAEGQSKRAAQMAAATAFLVREKVWIDDE